MTWKRCPRCGAIRVEAAAMSVLCPGCLMSLALNEGTAEGPADRLLAAATPEEGSAETTVARGTHRLPPGPAGSEPGRGAFLPGTVLARRYRVVGLIGRGGMAEVYRADDLKLGQPVALKFLPAELVKKEAWLERFASEVRIARQATHPNLCRIHDLQETGGLPFISMEYIDGEDLASLLRRIGRLPVEKAIQIAAELCSGLAALHAHGILHRDLKPANVMIDGRGRARITDFGLAIPAGQRPHDVQSGTPGYMAPEQRAGVDVSVRSDIYSLGLVLYELFTGHAAFPAPGELNENEPCRPSKLVPGLDPALDRILLHCLEPEPSGRPVSADAVMAALPRGQAFSGTDGAAETPLPEMLAASVSKSHMPLPLAVGGAAAALLLIASLVLLAGGTQISRIVALQEPPEVLVKTARDLRSDLGLPQLAKAAWGFVCEREALPDVLRRIDHMGAWGLDPGTPSPVLFWYGTDPSNPALNEREMLWPSPPVRPVAPALSQSIWLDPQGRLRRLVAGPDDTSGPATEQLSWSVLLKAAGVDLASLRPVAPKTIPPVPTDETVAWSGSYPGSGRSLLVEAGAFRRNLVYFEVGRYTGDGSPQRARSAGTGPAIGLLGTAWFIAALLGAVMLAVRNIRAGRSDRKSALRVATCLLLLRLGSWVIGGRHTQDLSELFLFTANLAWGLWYFCLGWVWYIAVEPYARRMWPGRMVSWVKLLDGRLRDPLVGRDWLVGILGGLGIAIVVRLGQLAPAWLGGSTARLDHLGPLVVGLPELRSLEGFFSSLAVLLACAKWAIFIGLLSLVPPILLRRVVRSRGSLILVVSILGVLGLLPASGSTPVAVLTAALVMSVWASLLLFVGVLPMVVALFVYSIVVCFPLTLDFTVWYAPASFLPLTLLVTSLGSAAFIATGVSQRGARA